MDLWEHIAGQAGLERGRGVDASRVSPVGGGDINRAFVLGRGGDRLFVKVNTADRLAMFEAEAAGLRELAQAGALRVPTPIVWGSVGGRAWLALEHVELGAAAPDGEAVLGEGLARLHAVTAERFGWTRDNTIGTTPQVNTRDSDWARFFAGRRLGWQLDLAARNGHGRALIDAGRRLAEKLPVLLNNHRPVPSLLHGDLWGGNAAFDRTGRPVIFDPAVYYGDRETDLAMTELFGGFGSRFQAAYRAAWPLDSGYEVRRDLYQLYHVLNHLNLFGGGYAGPARRLIERLLSAVEG